MTDDDEVGPLDDRRWNGTVVPHRSQAHVFSDTGSGDRIWVEEIPQIGMLQFWCYEEPDGPDSEDYCMSVVALDMEQGLKMYEYLGEALSRAARKALEEGARG